MSAFPYQAMPIPVPQFTMFARFRWHPADDYIFYEGDAVLGSMTLEYAALAVAGVGAVLLLTLVHPVACILMMVAVALVMLFLFGEMWVLNIRFNQVRAVKVRVKGRSKFMVKLRVKLTKPGQCWIQLTQLVQHT